jgi:UDP-N-acetylmuramoyl-tripeptide--D-alanyl-D-alanine ligase
MKRLIVRALDSEWSLEARRRYLYFWARLVLRAQKPRVVGITGTVGKTTTTECIAAVLMHPSASSQAGRVRKSVHNMNDNAGLPLTVLGYDDWPRSRSDWLKILLHVPFRAIASVADRRYPDTLVLEYGAGWGSDVHGLARLAPPTVAVVTSVGPAHLERFGSVEGVAREKVGLVQAVMPEGIVLLGPDNEFADTMARASPARVVRVEGRGRALSDRLATEVGEFFGVDPDAAKEALRSCEGAPGRLQIREVGDITLIDDVFNANPLSMKLGLDTLAAAARPGRRRVAVLGGMGELGEHTAEYHAHIAEYARRTSDIIVGVDTLAKRYAADIWYADSAACALALGDWLRHGDCVLVKGSHSANLRPVANAIEKWVGSAEQSTAATR